MNQQGSRPKNVELPEPLTYSVEEAASALGAGINTTRELIRAGELAHMRFGRRIRVPKRAVEDFISRQSEEFSRDRLAARRAAQR